MYYTEIMFGTWYQIKVYLVKAWNKLTLVVNERLLLNKSR